MKQIEEKEAFPLYWPDGYPRTKHPQVSRFRNARFGYVRDEMIDELRKMGATRVIISTNVPLRNDGLPYASAREPDDRGVAVYFRVNGDDAVLACDEWRTVQENIQAIRLTVQALRGIDRWGVSEILKRVFKGFAQLAAPMVAKRAWRDVMQFTGEGGRQTVDDVKSQYRHLAKKYHPDAGGSADQFAELEAAYREALEELGG